MSLMSGQDSSKPVQGLKQLNYQRSSGLLCLLETGKSQEIEPEITELNEQIVQNGNHGDTRPNTTCTCLFSEVSKVFRKKRSIANKCKVFVGNIGFKVKSREFREFFSSFGRVLQAQIVQDRIKKRSRG
jgi:hypothetical protein